MTWVFIVSGLAIAVALGLWWLERPLWHKSDGVRALENFLYDLVSPPSPWPLMYVEARERQCLVFSRERLDDGSIRLYAETSLQESSTELVGTLLKELESSYFSTDQITVTSATDGPRLRVDFGRADGPVLAEATQTARIILGQLGVQEDELLRVRYAGPMDAQVVGPELEDLERRGGPVARWIARAGLKCLRRRE